MLAENFGWTIDQIAELDMFQVEAIREGQSEVDKIRRKMSKNHETTMPLNKGKLVTERKELSKIDELFAAPGFAMTERARAAITAAKGKKQE